MKNLEQISWNGRRPRTDIELLELQAKQAKAAFKDTLQTGLQQLRRLSDPRPLIQEHPWKSSGVAALAGFFVAVAVSAPSSGQNAVPADRTKEEASSEQESAWGSLASLLMTTSASALKNALVPWLTQKIKENLPQSNKAADAKPDPLSSEKIPV